MTGGWYGCHFFVIILLNPSSPFSAAKLQRFEKLTKKVEAKTIDEVKTNPIYDSKGCYIRSEVTLYAKWKANSYKIAFSRSTYSAHGSMKTISASYNKTVKLPKNTFTRKSTQENKIDIEANIEHLAKEQEKIDKLYEKEGLTDEVLEKQVKLNQLRNKLDISDRKNRIYDRFVQ